MGPILKATSIRMSSKGRAGLRGRTGKFMWGTMCRVYEMAMERRAMQMGPYIRATGKKTEKQAKARLPLSKRALVSILTLF